VPDQRLLVLEAQPARGSAAGDDQGPRLDGLAGAEIQLEGTMCQIGLHEVAGHELAAETRCLLAHVLNQLRALNAFGEAGKILYQRGQGQLPAGLMPFHDQRPQVGARGIDGRCESGTAGSKDDGITNGVFHSS